MGRAGSQPPTQRTPVRILAVIVAVGAIAIAATTGDSWAVRSILVLVAADVAVRLWRW
jgi:Na+/H+ antiporter NhaC